MNTGWPNLYLISARMKAILEENGLTGWQTFPIKLYNIEGHEIIGYHGFSIATSFAKSEIVEKRMVP